MQPADYFSKKLLLLCQPASKKGTILIYVFMEGPKSKEKNWLHL